MNEILRVFDVGMRRSSIGSFALGLVENFKLRNIEIFLASVREMAAECGRTALNTEPRLMFVNFGYLMELYVPTI